MVTEIAFDKAQVKDISLLVSLDRMAFNRPFDNAFTEKEFKDLINNQNASIFLVMNQGAPVGFYITEKINSDEVEIVGIAVIPDYQNKKIGTQILNKVLSEFSKAKRIKVVTHPKNTIALLYYLKRDFVISDYKDTYYGPNQPRVILYKTNY